jgi:hypothetical protein
LKRQETYEQMNAKLQAKIDAFTPKGWDMSLAVKYIANNNAVIAKCRQQLEEAR